MLKYNEATSLCNVVTECTPVIEIVQMTFSDCTYFSVLGSSLKPSVKKLQFMVLLVQIPRFIIIV